MRSCRVSGCPTGSSCTGYSDYSTAEADKTGKSSGAKAVHASFLALTGCTIPLSSFCSFALLFFYTGFALIFFFFSQLLGLQVKANSVEFAGSFAIKASQDLTEAPLKSGATLVQHTSTKPTDQTASQSTPECPAERLSFLSCNGTKVSRYCRGTLEEEIHQPRDIWELCSPGCGVRLWAQVGCFQYRR